MADTCAFPLCTSEGGGGGGISIDASANDFRVASKPACFQCTFTGSSVD